MKKRAISASVAMLLVSACFRAGAETPPQAILQCAGEMTSDGINNPKDVALPSPSDVVGTYTLQGSVLIESGGRASADIRYDLCSSTSTTYVYSNDCSVSRGRYISDWLHVANAPASDRFVANHKGSAYGLNILVIDRVNLRVDSEYLTGELRTNYDQKHTKAWLTPYLMSMRFAGSCSVAKAKL
ncbi:hypothetical protein [Paraburkholderia sediminicola]|uniref:hypothetical protein n=1 Tax=Paraburkholderia sediminicola TaxID=458836 RepID=UPI0038B82132